MHQCDCAGRAGGTTEASLADYLANYVNSHPHSIIAALSRHGVTYTNNQTSSPSDSFPGLAALVTGGSRVTTGFWYDVTWNRALSPPAQTDGTGNPGGNCPGQIGTIMAMDESIDTILGANESFDISDDGSQDRGARRIQ